MNEINLHDEVERLIARILDSLAQKGNTKQDLQVIQERCKEIIALISLFPEMDKYEGFLIGLKKVNEEGPSQEITRFAIHTVSKFFDHIFTTHVRKTTS